ncbi:MAG TPA: hypothetical protein VM432_04025 [Bdellovibrionales bacterium]|nr:hypothetical protein [Bdellovibrionales bacterium]
MKVLNAALLMTLLFSGTASFANDDFDDRAWECQARDYVRIGYRYSSYDYYRARRGALNLCKYRSPIGGCYVLRCDSVWIP